MSVSKYLLKFLVMGVVGLPMTAQASLSNLVTNGSFETGDFGGWTISGTQPGPDVIHLATQYGDVITQDPFTYGPDAGATHQAYFFDDDATELLTQSVNLIAGQVYEVGFDLYPTVTGAANQGAYSLTGSLGSQMVASVNSTTNIIPTAKWTHFFGTYTPTVSGPADFSLTFTSAAGAAKDVLVDEVYVVAGDVTPTPEPALYAVLGLGLVGLCFRRKLQA